MKESVQLTVGFRNSFTRSFPCGDVGLSRFARFGPFSALSASFSCVRYVVNCIGILAVLCPLGGCSCYVLTLASPFIHGVGTQGDGIGVVRGVEKE